MKYICQSCGMKMKNKTIDRRGSETNGQRSDTYCNMCYLNGKFQEPNLTIEEMILKANEAIDQMKAPKFMKKLYKKTYPTQLKDLERWKK